jgi:hypothetical protein
MEEAVVALLSHRTIEEAAKTIGVTTKTLLRWMKDSVFDAEYRKARRAAFAQAVARLTQASGAAASMLVKMMLDPATPPSVRARVTDSVLAHCGKFMEIDDIEARVSEIERNLEASKKQGGGS